MTCANLELSSVRRLTWGAVSQFEGRTTDGRPVYVRLRHGELSVRIGHVGRTLQDAVSGADVYSGQYGDRHEFDITWPQVEAATGLRCIGAVDDNWA